MPDRCYCIFEGGGAKGIAHIGALSALEKTSLKLAGYAGTSAGALVAALAAAGYGSAEMFGQTRTILDDIDRDPTNTDGGPARKPVKTPTGLLGRHGWRAMRTAGRSAWILALAVVVAAFLPWILHWVGITGEAEALLLIPLLGACVAAWAWWMAEGLGRVEAVREAVNQALSLRVRNSRDPSPVTFADLAAAGRPPLRIVASDISSGKVALFSAEETPDVAVADAVAASICLPVVFSPWPIGGKLHFDGGLVSNLPAWTFDPEREVDRDAWTAAIEIADEGYGTPFGFGILKAAVLTAVFGSGMLNTRGVDKLRRLTLTVDLGLLEFNFDRARAAEIIADAEEEAQKLVLQLVDIPRHMGKTCVEAIADTRLALDAGRKAAGLGALGGHMRAAFFLPLADDSTALRNEFSHGFEDHADERIRLPRKGSFAGEALEKGALIAQRSDIDTWNRSLSRPEHRWVRKLLWKDQQWLICIPCRHGPSGRELVLVVDGDQPLGLDKALLDAILASLSERLTSILAASLPEELFKW